MLFPALLFRADSISGLSLWFPIDFGFSSESRMTVPEVSIRVSLYPVDFATEMKNKSRALVSPAERSAEVFDEITDKLFSIPSSTVER